MADQKKGHQHPLGSTIGHRDNHQAVVLWARRTLQPLPADYHPYATKWRAMAAQAMRLPADDPYRQKVEEAAAIITRVAERTQGLYALAVSSMAVAHRRIHEPNAGEITGDDRRARRAM